MNAKLIQVVGPEGFNRVHTIFPNNHRNSAVRLYHHNLCLPPTHPLTHLINPLQNTCHHSCTRCIWCCVHPSFHIPRDFRRHNRLATELTVFRLQGMIKWSNPSESAVEGGHHIHKSFGRLFPHTIISTFVMGRLISHSHNLTVTGR